VGGGLVEGEGRFFLGGGGIVVGNYEAGEGRLLRCGGSSALHNAVPGLRTGYTKIISRRVLGVII